MLQVCSVYSQLLQLFSRGCEALKHDERVEMLRGIPIKYRALGPLANFPLAADLIEKAIITGEISSPAFIVEVSGSPFSGSPLRRTSSFTVAGA